MQRINVIIMGAAGRDFHNYNIHFRNSDIYKVVAFTATQIPGIANRKYPPELAGSNYPDGIPIYSEDQLSSLVREQNVEQVIFAYSDVTHEYVMHKASEAIANGADFRIMGPKTTMLKAKVPLVAVCAVRTGSGKSQTSRKVAGILKQMGLKVVVLRHPMPYGDLGKQVCQRFVTYSDLDKYECTIEEREEYEPHIDNGIIVYAGIDYEKILRAAEREADVIVWDGGNNDLPFIWPDLHIVVVDPHRAGNELVYYPGESNLRMADVVIINKVETAKPEDVKKVRSSINHVNPKAKVLEAASPVKADKPELIKSRRVLVIEDGPTLTHGNMSYGAGTIIAKKLKAMEIVDPRPYALGSIKRAYEKYSHLGPILPALGYSERQITELEETIQRIPCDTVVIGTPVDLRRIIRIDKPTVRIKYELKVLSPKGLEEILVEVFKEVRKDE